MENQAIKLFRKFQCDYVQHYYRSHLAAGLQFDWQFGI
jgi:hypothetical protein